MVRKRTEFLIGRHVYREKIKLLLYPRDVYKLNNLFLETYVSLRMQGTENGVKRLVIYIPLRWKPVQWNKHRYTYYIQHVGFIFIHTHIMFFLFFELVLVVCHVICIAYKTMHVEIVYQEKVK